MWGSGGAAPRKKLHFSYQEIKNFVDYSVFNMNIIPSITVGWNEDNIFMLLKIPLYEGGFIIHFFQISKKSLIWGGGSYLRGGLFNLLGPTTFFMEKTRFFRNNSKKSSVGLAIGPTTYRGILQKYLKVFESMFWHFWKFSWLCGGLKCEKWPKKGQNKKGGSFLGLKLG